MRCNVYGLAIIIAMLSVPRVSLACGMGGGDGAVLVVLAMGLKAVIDTKETLDDPEKKLKELRASYSEKDPEAAVLIKKVEGYDTKLGALTTRYHKLEGYLRNKLPILEKNAEQGSTPVTETESVSTTSEADTMAEPEKKPSRWGRVVNKAKSVFKRKTPDSPNVSEVGDNTEVEPAQTAETIDTKPIEEENLTSTKSSLESQIQNLTTDRSKAKGELETFLSNKYPKYKFALERLRSLKRSDDSAAGDQ